MAVRRSSTILCASAFALAIAAFKVADVSFVGSKAATRTLGVARFEESGKRGHVPTQDEVTGRRPAIEMDRKTPNAGTQAPGTQKGIFEFIQYTVFHVWRTWFFSTLFLIGTWCANGFSFENGVQLLIGHPFLYATFGSIARRVYGADWKQIENGNSEMPYDATMSGVLRWGNPDKIWRFGRAARQTLERATRQGRIEIPDRIIAAPNGQQYPKYYLQNFHYQTDGWMSLESSATYEMSTEVLFGGTQDAMQRIILPPLRAWLNQQGDRQCKLLDAGCGTGRLLCQVARNFPSLELVASDLSPYYLETCKENYAAWSAEHEGAKKVQFLHANMEELPVADGSLDVVVCAYVFHELPPLVRRRVIAEFQRVLRSGGLCVFIDSVQAGDLGPSMEGVLEWFPRTFHEPYYESWLREDVVALFRANGFNLFSRPYTMHVSKATTFTKV